MITLRKLLYYDLDTVFRWENNPELWAVSEQKGPFSQDEIKAFVEKCLDEENPEITRWIICWNEEPIGAVDLFDLNPGKGTCGIGIFISDKQFRNRGYAGIALRIMIATLKDRPIQKLEAIIHDDNRPSVKLFLGHGFMPAHSLYYNQKKATCYSLRISE
jgi:diamine N-acetyltransferase